MDGQKEREMMAWVDRCRTCGSTDADCFGEVVVAGQACCTSCVHEAPPIGTDLRVARHGHLDGWRVAFAGFVIVASLLLALTEPGVFNGKDVVAIVTVVAVTAWAVR